MQHWILAEELALQPKGHKVKVAIAKRLRKETTMTLKWIAQRLQMGSWTDVFNLLASEKSHPIKVNRWAFLDLVDTGHSLLLNTAR